MQTEPPSSGPSNRGSNFEKNRRPASSKRVTFALGQDAQDQVDRLARVLSTYQKGGVSQSALVRGLIQFAETIALQSGDPAVKPVFESAAQKVGKPDAEAIRIWERIRSEIAGS